jgi:hypothetical protein
VNVYVRLVAAFAALAAGCGAAVIAIDLVRRIFA